MPILNPAVLLASLVTFLAAAGIGFYGGYQWEVRAHAAAQLAVANFAADKARADAKTESEAALAIAQAAAKARAATSEKRHQLELEIARDETARNCRVSDGVFGMLQQSIRSANGAPSSAVRIDGGLPTLSGTSKPVSSGFGAGAAGWLGGLRLLSIGKAGAGGVD
jgi:hypothetical protein